jgi:hypothetical protein
MRVVMYSRKVSEMRLRRGATLTTCKIIGTKSTHVCHTEESDANDKCYEDWSSYSSESSDGVEETVKDAVSRIKGEIMQLDKIGFDEILHLEETQDM